MVGNEGDNVLTIAVGADAQRVGSETATTGQAPAAEPETTRQRSDRRLPEPEPDLLSDIQDHHASHQRLRCLASRHHG